MYGLTVLPVRHTQLLFGRVPHTAPQWLSSNLHTFSAGEHSTLGLLEKATYEWKWKWKQTHHTGKLLYSLHGSTGRAGEDVYNTDNDRSGLWFHFRKLVAPNDRFLSKQQSDSERRKICRVRKREGELWHLPDTLMAACLHCGMLTSFTSTDGTSLSSLGLRGLWGFGQPHLASVKI